MGNHAETQKGVRGAHRRRVSLLVQGLRLVRGGRSLVRPPGAQGRLFWVGRERGTRCPAGGWPFDQGRGVPAPRRMSGWGRGLLFWGSGRADWLAGEPVNVSVSGLEQGPEDRVHGGVRGGRAGAIGVGGPGRKRIPGAFPSERSPFAGVRSRAAGPSKGGDPKPCGAQSWGGGREGEGRNGWFAPVSSREGAGGRSGQRPPFPTGCSAGHPLACSTEKVF